MNRKPFLLLLVLLALTVSALAILWRYRAPEPVTTSRTAQSERRVLYWTDPMTPGYRSDKPGKSPFMDMDLVPVYEENAAGNIVTVRPEIINNLGVRTYRISRTDSVRRVKVQGFLYREQGHLYALVDLLDRQATAVRAGLSATINVTDLPGQTWDAVVERVEPNLDIGTRELKARLRIKTPGPALRPNMFAEATIRLPATGAYLAIPREALIRTGTRTATILALGGGRFQPVDVVPGEESGDWIEIRQGLKEGDTVVVSGQFLIDSEASVRASFQRMEPVPAEPHDDHAEKKP